MCGRYELNATPAMLKARFGPLLPEAEWEGVEAVARYNVAPAQRCLAIRYSRRAGHNVAEPLIWGFRPSWAVKHWINARDDRLFSAPAFREAARKRRCLVVASGWYEWRAHGGARKQPYYLHFDGLFAFAGVWTARKLDAEAWELNFAIVTTAAHPSVAAIHDRMPLVLRPEHYAAWLDPSTKNPRALIGAFGDEPRAHPVSPVVNDPHNDVPACIETVVPADPEGG